MAIKCPTCHSENPDSLKFCGECGTKLDFSAPGHPSGPGDRTSFTKTLETTADELTRGTLFAGRYEIIEELGAGGMGRVYRAHDTKLNEEVALKLIRPEFGIDKRMVERFQNEIKIARRISHKNVCRMYDFHEDGKILYLTMEYVRGEDLKSFVKRSKVLSTGTALSITRQVAEGLSEAHKLGVIHRDLKPGNIMIDKEGQAKIMDFGIARAMWEKGITGAGAIVGTPEYMSPEQVEGKEADQRSDIYALGVILFEMVTGQVPFEGETPFSIANKHKSEPPPIPKKLVPQIPEGLNKLILRCLEKDKAKRYQTADELLEDLAMVEGALPTAERVAPRRKTVTHHEITVKFEPRKLLIPAAAVLVLAAAGYLLWHNVIPPPTRPVPSAKPTLALLSFRNNSGNPAFDVWRENLPTLLAGGLGQSRYLRLLDDPTVYGILKKLNLLSAEKFTTEELKRIAAEGQATHLLSGNYLEAGGKFIINVSLIDAGTGTVLAPIQAEAQNREAIYNSVDGLVKKVESALNIPEQAIDERTYKMVGDVYTRNSKAFQSYIEGEKLRFDGDSAKAILAFEKAIELDPEFAMAYRQLGFMYWVSDFGKKYENLRKAYELRDRLPEKDRLLVEGGWYMLREETLPKALDAFKKVVERYPDDFLGHQNLAFTAGELEKFDEAIRESEYIWHNFKRLGNLVYYFCLREDYKRARESYQEFVDANPKDPWCHCYLAWLYQLEKNLDAAAKEYATAASLAPKDPWIRAQVVNIDWIKDASDKALQTLRDIAKTQTDTSLFDDLNALFFMIKGKLKETHALGDKTEKKALSESWDNISLAELFTRRGTGFLQTGKAEMALEKFRQGLEYVSKEESKVPEAGVWFLMHRKRVLMMWEACALCDLGRVEEAEALYKKVDALIPIPDYTKKLPKVCWCKNPAYVAGKIALAKKDYATAVRSLEESVRKMYGEDSASNSDHAYFFDLLGDAYEQDGRLDKAAETYAHIRELQSGRADWGAVYSRSFYKLGKVYERMGKKAEARDNYRKFLDLWKDADPGLPEVEDAKKRLSNLGI